MRFEVVRPSRERETASHRMCSILYLSEIAVLEKKLFWGKFESKVRNMKGAKLVKFVQAQCDSVTRKKSPNVYKSYPKMISLDFDTLTKIA